jgi:hypothetical protein
MASNNGGGAYAISARVRVFRADASRPACLRAQLTEFGKARLVGARDVEASYETTLWRASCRARARASGATAHGMPPPARAVAELRPAGCNDARRCAAHVQQVGARHMRAVRGRALLWRRGARLGGPRPGGLPDEAGAAGSVRARAGRAGPQALQTHLQCLQEQDGRLHSMCARAARRPARA